MGNSYLVDGSGKHSRDDCAFLLISRWKGSIGTVMTLEKVITAPRVGRPIQCLVV